MMRLGAALFGVVALDGVVGQDGPSCAAGGNVAVNVGGTDGNVVTTVDIPAGGEALYACSGVDTAYGGSVVVSCSDDASPVLSGNATHCLETSACHALAEAYVSACDTTDEAVAETTCPAGCMQAYEALVADTTCVTAWQEPVFSGDALGPFSRLLAESFGLSDGTMPWGISGAWRRFDVTVETLVHWASLRNRLQDRCLWPAYATECSYRYFMAVEVLSGPGEALGYNCAVKNPTCTETAAVSVEADAAACAAVTALDSADACQAVLTADTSDDAGTTACTYTPIRDDASCTDECDAIKDAVLDNCDATDTYTNSAGIVADYNAMVGAMNIQMACANFTCGLNAVGEAFCGVLESMAMTDLETEDTVTGSGEQTSMSAFVDLGCNSQLRLAPGFMALLPDDYLPPRAVQCIAEMSGEYASVYVKNVCACTMTEMCPSDGRFEGPDGGLYDDSTATTCTLVPSTDHGATLGTCTDSDTTDTAYCTYNRGRYCYSAGTADTVAVPDSCTSVAVAGGAEVESDTTNCYLTGSSDFGVTPGSCAAIDDAAYSCTYVPGTYCSSTGEPDTETAPDMTPRISGESCVVVTPPTAEQCAWGAYGLEAPPPPPEPATSPATPAPATSAATARVVTAALLGAVVTAAFA